MKKTKSNFMRAVNDVLLYDGDCERRFVDRLYNNVYDGVIALHCNMSKTMRGRVLDIADAVTTIVLYRLYDVDGRENEQRAMRFLNQWKCLRVWCDSLCNCLSIHDLPDEMLNKVETTGKPLFNFINKNY